MIKFNEFLTSRIVESQIDHAARLVVECRINPVRFCEAVEQLELELLTEAGVAPAPAPYTGPTPGAFSGLGNTVKAAGSGLGRFFQGVWTGMKDMWAGDLNKSYNSAVGALQQFAKAIGSVQGYEKLSSVLGQVIGQLQSWKDTVAQAQKARENQTRGNAMNPGLPNAPGQATNQPPQPGAAPAAGPAATGTPTATPTPTA
jgi:uncharacterized protein YukE